MILFRDQVTLLLIKLVYFFILMNAPLMKVGIRYSYLVVFIMLIVFLLFGGGSLSRLKQFSLHLAYLVLMTVFLVVTVIFMQGGNDSFISFGLYTLPMMIWILFYSNRNGVLFSRIFVSTYGFTVIISYLGIVQYFFSPNIFGWIPSDSMSIDWAVDKPFVEYAVFFRATSTLGSPQVFGLFCALNAILTLRFKNCLSSCYFWFGLLGLCIGGILTGNKSFFLIFFLYLLMTNLKNIFRYFKFFIFSVSCVIILVFNYDVIVKNLPILERVFSISSILEQESSGSESRLGRYSYILYNSNPFIGEGIGSITNKSVDKLQAPESYFLKIYYEAGAFVMLFFMFLCFFSYFSMRKVDRRDGAIILLIILGMIVVHAFESPVFFIIWGYLLGGVVINREQSRYFYER